MVQSQSVLNPMVLERIRKVGGSGLVERLLDYFLANAPERFHQLTDAIQQDDWKAVEFHAHSLKSSSGNVGADSLRFVLDAIETAAEAHQGDAVRAARAALEVKFEEFLKALQHLRQIE